jgi:hypothetical protein
LAIRLLAPFRETPEYFHWSQQRLAFVKALIYTLDFTRPKQSVIDTLLCVVI